MANNNKRLKHFGETGICEPLAVGWTPADMIGGAIRFVLTLDPAKSQDRLYRRAQSVRAVLDRILSSVDQDALSAALLEAESDMVFLKMDPLDRADVLKYIRMRFDDG